MPSVMTTASGMPASMASMTAPLAKAGGTKMTETSAPVSFIASATVPNTGIWVPSISTFSPALRGLTPPTIFEPEASMRRVCFIPSEPVMPWTMIFEFSSRKIAILVTPLLRRGELGRAGSGAVHGVHLLESGQPGLGQDLAAELGVVAVEPDHQRLVHGLAARAEQREGLHDAVGHRVAGGDAAEDVDEHGLDRRVAQDDLQAVGHHLGRGAAADVKEVRRLDAAVRLPGVGDHVEGGHDQAGAVADDADLAVELDVVEVLLLGLGLQRVGRGLVLELGVVRLAEPSVGVEADLAVQRGDLAVRGLDQRVDLDQERV